MLVIIVALILCSAFFSATETAFTGANRIRLKNLASEGNRRAALALQLSDNFDTLLSTILIGNNLVNIVATTMSAILFTRWFGADSGPTFSTIAMTLLVLIFGEITPKSLAKEAPEKFVMFAAPLMRVMNLILTPLNVLFSGWKALLGKVFRIGGRSTITEDELITMIDEVEQEGVLDQNESELLRSAIEFNDVDVEEILTHRVDMVAIDDEDSMEDILKAFRDSPYSRLPVYHETIDHITGILHEQDFMMLMHQGKTSITEAVKPAIFVPETMKISLLLRMFQREKTHMAIVLDEFGGTTGLVTMEDILEELVGEIYDEHDNSLEEFRWMDDDTCFVGSNVGLDDLFEELHFEKDPDSYDSNTVSGWIMEELGRLPREGDEFTFEGWNVLVTRMEERRVMEVCVHRLAKEE
ncbi:MAG: HlyC/CorC family transporter [Firmicutes bacterium]|nr:HlyC/CorC family transporter [Bacillota bacterium]